MKKKGFTLIELLAVIVILAVIALIATPMIMGVVETSRQEAAKESALGYIDAIEKKVVLSEIGNVSYEDKEDYVYDEINVDIKGATPTGGIYSLEKGIVTTGTFCINGYEVSYANNETVVEGNCTGEELKLSGGIKLSSNSGSYTYPDSGTFEVIENISGGTLSCTSDNEEVATCSIEGSTVTVTPGVKEGSATLTIKSEGSSKYKEAIAAYVASTAKGLISYTANDYTGVYDGEGHSIVVSSENAIIKYGLEEGSYTLDASPEYTDVGEYTVYYEIVKAGFNTITGSKQVIITKAEGQIELEERAGTVEYNNTNSVEIIKNVSNGELSTITGNADIVDVSIENNKIVIYGKQVGTTTITVLSGETNNYNSTSIEYEITVTKANNILTLSENTGSYTYPDSGEFTVETNTSGGALSCTSDDENVATCSIEDSTVTVTPGTTAGSATLTIKSEATANYNAGQAAYVVTTASGTLSVTASNYNKAYDGAAHGITVTCSGATITYATSSTGTYSSTKPTYTDVGTYTTYYKVTKAGYTTVTGSKTVTITKAAGSVTAPTAKSLTYNGSAQALINAGSSGTGTIQYKLGSTGTYGTAIPTATNAGTYTVYYKVVGDSNHNDVAEKSVSVTINKKAGAATLSETSGTVNAWSSTTFNVSENTGSLSCTSSSTSIATCSVSGTTVTVKGVAAGSATITVNVASSTNYNATSKTYSVTVNIPICKRADVTTLHKETCTQTSNYCYAAGYTSSDKGTTITYGNQTVTEGTLTSGDAFDCDVNGDGNYDPTTERFYYASGLNGDNTSNVKVLIYYNNTSRDNNGKIKPDNTATSLKAYYPSADENWHGPTEAIKNLPSVNEWTNVTLTNTSRNITNNRGTNTTNNGSNAIENPFTYKNANNVDYVARLITYKEVATACGGDGNPTSTGELDACNYLMENTKYSASSMGTVGYWLETPYTVSAADAWYVNGTYRSMNISFVSYASNYGVRPAIEVLESNISY